MKRSNMYQQEGGYMPQGDAEFRDWLANFALLIKNDPAKFTMTPADATVIWNHHLAYEAVYLPSKQPTMRTPSLLQQKDAVKASAMASCRVYAMIIKNAAGVDNEDKSALGLRIDDTTPSPAPVPTTAPMLAIQGAFSGEHIIRYVDETTPTSRRKPPSVKFIEIYCNIAWGANPDQSTAKSVGLYGTQPIRVDQQQVNAGKTATYFGRWVNTRGEVGPWSLPIAMTIAFGGPVDQQMPTGGTPGIIEGDDQLKIAA